MVKRTACIALLTTALLASGAGADQSTLPETVGAQLRLIEQYPNDALLHNDLGNLYLLIGKVEEAEAAYRQALTLDPELVSAHFNLGLLFQQTQRAAKAMRAYKSATKLQPDHAWAHYQLGVINSDRGRRHAAIRNYARALRLEPRLTDPAYNPNILDNGLAPSATLAAYADDSSADLVPRDYESPRRIADLLVPGLPEAADRLGEQRSEQSDAASNSELGKPAPGEEKESATASKPAAAKKPKPKAKRARPKNQPKKSQDQ